MNEADSTTAGELLCHVAVDAFFVLTQPWSLLSNEASDPGMEGVCFQKHQPFDGDGGSFVESASLTPKISGRPR